MTLRFSFSFSFLKNSSGDHETFKNADKNEIVKNDFTRLIIKAKFSSEASTFSQVLRECNNIKFNSFYGSFLAK